MVQPVGHRLVGPEDAEVLRVGVELEQVADVAAQFDHVLLLHAAGERDVHGIVAEVRCAQVPQQLAAVGVGVGRDAPVAGGGQRLQFGDQGAVLVKQLLGVVAAQPLLQLGQVFLLIGGAQRQVDGLLVGTEGALDRLAVHDLRASPALGGAQDDHRPLDMAEILAGAGAALDVVDFLNHGVEGLGHLLVHRQRVVALDEVGLPAAAQEEVLQLLAGHAAEHGGDC